MIAVLLFFVFSFVLFHILTPRHETPITVTCPPHKWKSVAVKDESGNVVMHKLLCEKCGPPQHEQRDV